MLLAGNRVASFQRASLRLQVRYLLLCRGLFALFERQGVLGACLDDRQLGLERDAPLSDIVQEFTVHRVSALKLSPEANS